MNKKANNTLDKTKIPRHVVIIMDGNGRWAKKKKLDRINGHREGMKSVSSIVKSARDFDIKYLTLYAFSTQNWNRPKNEVLALMELLKHYLVEESNRLIERDIKLNAIGRLNDLPKDAYRTLESIIERTKNCKSMTLTLALSYGGREEIIDAVKKIKNNKNLTANKINENLFSSFLYTHNLPEPDLLIRTSGEMRLSNFLLWQLAYTEIYVTRTLWPNFRRRHLIKALLNFQERERRFGLTGEQIQEREII